MNDRNDCMITQPEGVYHKFELLQEIDDTLTEMEIYLKRHPEDEMARLQYEQYFKKREALVEPFLLYCETVNVQGNAANNERSCRASPDIQDITDSPHRKFRLRLFDVHPVNSISLHNSTN